MSIFPRISSPFKLALYLAPAALLALSTGCDRDDLVGSPNSVNNAGNSSTLSRERQDQALMSSVVEGNPDLWAPGSCAGACGGPAPDRSCFCDASCVRHGDCCHDYQRECLADGGGGNDQPKKKKPEIKILNVQVSGSGCGRDPSTGRPNHETFINSFNADHGYKDNSFRTYFRNKVFELGTPEGTPSKACRLTALVKWTPGHRITVHQVSFEGEARLHGTLEGTANFAIRPNAGSGPGEVSEANYSSPFDAPIGHGWLRFPDTYSNCSGLGYVTYDLNAGVMAQGGSAKGGVKSFHSALQFPQAGEVPDC